MRTIPISRREMLKRALAGASVTLLPSLVRGVESASTKTRFKIGVVDWELGKAANPEAIAIAARLGFDGLQVDLGKVDPLRDPERQKQYRVLSQQHKVAIASLALGALSETPFGQNEKGQLLVEKALEVAKAMDQKLLLLAFFGNNDLGKKENNLDALAGRLKEIAPKAEKAGVVLGVEGETTAERYKELVDRVGSPAVKVYFDCVHAHVNGRDISQEITLLGDRICEFHAKDYGNILFGQGKIDWRQVRRGMDAIGYRGWILVEQWGEINGDKPLGFDETHRRNLRFLREIFPPA